MRWFPTGQVDNIVIQYRIADKLSNNKNDKMDVTNLNDGHLASVCPTHHWVSSPRLPHGLHDGRPRWPAATPPNHPHFRTKPPTPTPPDPIVYQ
jgi:hypothetical protein